MRVPWGDLSPVRQDYPQLGDVDPADVRTGYAPVMVRLDGGGGVHLTSGRDAIVHCGPDGTVTGSTPLPAGHLVDFAADAETVVTLVTGGEVRATDHSGRPLWTVAGEFTGVLLGERLHLPERSTVREVDPRTGATLRTLDRRPDAGRLFLAAGVLCAVYTDFDAGVRGIEVITPDGSRASTGFRTREHFAWLVHPIGFDRHLSAYAWRNDRVARITATGLIEELNPIAVPPAPGELPPPNQWLVTPDSQIIIPLPTTDGVTLLTHH